MMQRIFWLVLAAIHLLPALALFRPRTLTALYGIRSDNPLFLLMQHRAGLFLAVLTACLWAAFDPAGRKLAAIVAGTSMVSFLVLYWLNGAPLPLRRIALVDLAAMPVLAFVAYAAFAGRS